jgi:hypothetical protein
MSNRPDTEDLVFLDDMIRMEIKRAVAKAVAAEREACARAIIERSQFPPGGNLSEFQRGAKEAVHNAVALIRARGTP